MKKFIAILVIVVMMGKILIPAHARAITCGAGTPVGSTCVVVLTVGPGNGNQTWNVPADWNNSSNQVACIGSGGKGGTPGGSGGGGGAFASSTNVSLAPGGTASYAIGTSSTTTLGTLPQMGTFETYFNGTASSSSSLTCDWGRAGTSTTAGIGGMTSQSIGATLYAGGNGGAALGVSTTGGAGGGGSAGEYGIGQLGGSSTLAKTGGGGGGSNGGSSSAGSDGGVVNSGAGGNGTGGTGGGAAKAPSGGAADGNPGTAGTGGGGSGEGHHTGP